MTTLAPRMLAGPHALRDRFDGFLIDLWGVVHDGEAPFDGVVEALRRLTRSGGRICFLSNSSRLGSLLAENLVAMGVDRDVFETVVSSGDVTRQALVERDTEVFATLPPQVAVLHVGNPAYVPWLFELDFRFVDDVDRADLVVSTGTVGNETELRRLGDRLAPLVSRGVPLVCTNPDRVVLSKAGLHLAPGAVAQTYAERGGRTFLYGKPHAPIYRSALERLRLPAERIVAIGDMLETDVLGARRVGLTSVLVCDSGVHAAELGTKADPERLEALFTRVGVRPDALLERFVDPD